MYVISGSITLALLFETQSKVANNFAFMKTVGSFDYLASFPIKASAFVAASTLAFGLLALPAVIVTSIAGVAILRVPVNLSPLLLVAVVVCIVPFACVGAIIGARSRSLEEASAISVAVTLLAAALGPVAVPPAMLPDALNVVGVVNPAVYASRLIRDCLLGGIDTSTWIAFGVMTVLTVIALVITRAALRWRQ